MENKTIATSLGDIHLAMDRRGGTRPIIFLHGLFLDRSLWDAYDPSLTGRTHVYIDMPAHGKNGPVGKAWSDADCVDALMSVLDQLGIENCTVIGHSWGAIIALRAVTGYPARFDAVGLFNMPFLPPNGAQRLGAHIQKLLAHFPRFYAGQVSNALYAKPFLKDHSDRKTKMQVSLAERPWREIAWIIDAVMIKAIDLRPLLAGLECPVLAVVGEVDHVGSPPGVETLVVQGGHVSPHEAVDEIRGVIRQLCG